MGRREGATSEELKNRNGGLDLVNYFELKLNC